MRRNKPPSFLGHRSAGDSGVGRFRREVSEVVLHPPSADYHVLLGKHNTGETTLGSATLLSKATVERMREVAMLWHWRSRDGTASRSFFATDAIDLASRVFGQEQRGYFNEIPTSESPSDFLVGQTPFRELDRVRGRQLLIQARWRHHALEWLLGEESWENTTTDT